MMFDKHANLKYKFEIGILGRERILCKQLASTSHNKEMRIQEQERKILL